MSDDFISGENHFFPAVASTEVIHVVSSLVAIPASAGISFPYREHPRFVGLEIRIHILPCRRRKTASALPFREWETVDFPWCTRQGLNLHGSPQWTLGPSRIPIPPLVRVCCFFADGSARMSSSAVCHHSLSKEGNGFHDFAALRTTIQGNSGIFSGRRDCPHLLLSASSVILPTTMAFSACRILGVFKFLSLVAPDEAKGVSRKEMPILSRNLTCRKECVSIFGKTEDS